MKIGTIVFVAVIALLFAGAASTHAQKTAASFPGFDAKLSGTNLMSATLSSCGKGKFSFGSEKEHPEVIKLQADRWIDVDATVFGTDHIRTRRVKTFYVKVEGRVGAAKIRSLANSNAAYRWEYDQAIDGCVNVSKDKREAEETVVLIRLRPKN